MKLEDVECACALTFQCMFRIMRRGSSTNMFQNIFRAVPRGELLNRVKIKILGLCILNVYSSAKESLTCCMDKLSPEGKDSSLEHGTARPEKG